MNLMLGFLLFAVVVGLFGSGLGRWQQAVLGLGALALVALYHLFPYRFM